MSNVPTRRRCEALAPHLHSLGVRPLAELLIDIAQATAQPEIILARAEAFAAITPQMVCAARADRLPPRLSPVPSTRSWQANALRATEAAR